MRNASYFKHFPKNLIDDWRMLEPYIIHSLWETNNSTWALYDISYRHINIRCLSYCLISYVFNRLNSTCDLKRIVRTKNEIGKMESRHFLVISLSKWNAEMYQFSKIITSILKMSVWNRITSVMDPLSNKKNYIGCQRNLRLKLPGIMGARLRASLKPL